MDFKCYNFNCKYNNKSVCKSKNVLISKNCNCKTFCLNENFVDENNDVCYKPAPFKHCKKYNITCKTNCLFNVNGKCVANGLNISKEKGEPTCFTYIKK